MSINHLNDWLELIKNQHRQEIDLGLERVKQVAGKLNLLRPTAKIITVGGTNGKGSTVAGLEAVYLAGGYKVGAFTSPYLYRFNELVRIQGKPVSDEDFIKAFERIEQARGELTLTQFEFNTLAALDIFQKAKVEVGILEVGLGGRLDAVNIIDADIAVITSIAIDHTDWLGNSREEIAHEKAGIFRTRRPAVCGDIDPPTTLLTCVNEKKIPFFCQNQDFGFQQTGKTWSWWCQEKRLDNLPQPRLALQNMSTALMVVELMQDDLLIDRRTIDRAMASVELAGRIQVIEGDVTKILDVSHNPAAAQWLADYLHQQTYSGTVRAVFSMLADKDILATLQVMRDCFDEWYIAALPVERGASLDVLKYCFRSAGIKAVKSYESIKMAYDEAFSDSQPGDCLVVFGSFYTVGSAHSADL